MAPRRRAFPAPLRGAKLILVSVSRGGAAALRASGLPLATFLAPLWGAFPASNRA
jgi:hypothetical protein